MPRHPHLLSALILTLAVLGLAAAEPPDSDSPDSSRSDDDSTPIRLLVPPGRELAGRTEVEILAIDPEIYRVVFLLDGEEVAIRNHPPWKAKVTFTDPAREQTVEARAYGAKKRLLGSDTLTVNLKRRPFRVDIKTLRGNDDNSAFFVEADVSVPRGAELDRIDFFFNETYAGTVKGEPFAALVTGEASGSGDFVRVLAFLKDGRRIEDVALIDAPGLLEEVDVNLVQLQALVVKKNGAPVTDLTAEDFVVVQGAEEQQIEAFFPAPEVTLLLGLILDTSGSMSEIWTRTLDTAKQFLARTLSARDRAFLVNFDDRLELAHPLTADRTGLFEALDALEPRGGTALYDSMLYSLLQFESEPGRRALIVLTDGFDSRSTTNAKLTVDFAHKLGVPIYVVALPSGPPPSGARAMQQMSPVHALKLITDPTGGRLLRAAGSAAGLDRAFSQINAELRHQYILLYYTDVLPDDKGQKIKVRVKDRNDVEVRAVFAWDQVS